MTDRPNAPDANASGITPSFDPAFDLEMAYRFSEETARHDAKTLFWAIDRFQYDRAETEDGRQQRFDARQRIAAELDRRGVPVRDPSLPSSYPGKRSL